MSTNTVLASAPLTTTGFHIKATGTTLGNSLIWDNGTNVGINTSSPNSQLSIVNNTSGTATTMGLYNSTLAAGSGGGYEFWYNNSIRLGGIYQKTTSDGNNFYMSFESYAGAGGATERMRIASTGNVGIGTSSPNVSGQGTDQRVLTVQGTNGVWGGVEVSVTGNTSAGALNGFYGFTNASLSAGYKLVSYIGSWLDGGGVTSGADIRFFTQSNTAANAIERMRITSVGNVGIGTTAPTAFGAGYKTLSVGGSTTTEGGVIESQTNGATAIYFGSNSSQSFIQETRNLPMVFYTNNAERMRITGAGKVLIGTTTSTASYALELGTSGGGVWGNCANSGDAQFISYSPTIGFHYYAFTSSPVYYVLTNGDVKNANNSYGAISDIKLKENITDATPKLNDLLKVKIRNYNLISDESKTKQICVIAQEL